MLTFEGEAKASADQVRIRPRQNPCKPPTIIRGPDRSVRIVKELYCGKGDSRVMNAQFGAEIRREFDALFASRIASRSSK